MTITVEQRSLCILAEIASYSSSRYGQPSMHDRKKQPIRENNELEHWMHP